MVHAALGSECRPCRVHSCSVGRQEASGNLAAPQKTARETDQEEESCNLCTWSCGRGCGWGWDVRSRPGQGRLRGLESPRPSGEACGRDGWVTRAREQAQAGVLGESQGEGRRRPAAPQFLQAQPSEPAESGRWPGPLSMAQRAAFAFQSLCYKRSPLIPARRGNASEFHNSVLAPRGPSRVSDGT